MVEIWFGIIEHHAIHRGTFGNVRDPTTAILTYIDGWNNRAHPFVWTKTGDGIVQDSQSPNHFKRGPLDRFWRCRQLSSRSIPETKVA